MCVRQYIAIKVACWKYSRANRKFLVLRKHTLPKLLLRFDWCCFSWSIACLNYKVLLIFFVAFCNLLILIAPYLPASEWGGSYRVWIESWECSCSKSNDGSTHVICMFALTVPPRNDMISSKIEFSATRCAHIFFLPSFFWGLLFGKSCALQ